MNVKGVALQNEEEVKLKVDEPTHSQLAVDEDGPILDAFVDKAQSPFVYEQLHKVNVILVFDTEAHIL